MDALTGEGLSTGYSPPARRSRPSPTASRSATRGPGPGPPAGTDCSPGRCSGSPRGPARGRLLVPAAARAAGLRPPWTCWPEPEAAQSGSAPDNCARSAIRGKLDGCGALVTVRGPEAVVSEAGASTRRDPGRPTVPPPSLVREVALVASLFLVYRLGRLAITGHDELAVTNAWWVWDIERTLRLPDEELFQQWALQWPDLLRAANWYYVGVHFPLTAAFLIWGWLRRPPEEYRYARRLLSLLTGLALIVHVVMPLAPPRMLSSLGFLDTMAVFGPSAYGDSTATIANQFAAMPSLHVGLGAADRDRGHPTATSPWRWVAVLHPVITVMVVVATANHYWVDAIAAALLLLVAIVVVPQPYGPSLLALVGVGSGRRSCIAAGLGTARRPGYSARRHRQDLGHAITRRRTTQAVGSDRRPSAARRAGASGRRQPARRAPPWTAHHRPRLVVRARPGPAG